LLSVHLVGEGSEELLDDLASDVYVKDAEGIVKTVVLRDDRVVEDRGSNG
jgi:hypothetical protein